MEAKTQKAALGQIKELKRRLQSKALARFFCCMQSGDKNYVCSMDNLERIFDKYLEEVDGLIKTYDLGHAIYLKFKKETAEIIRDAPCKGMNLNGLSILKKIWTLSFSI